MLNWQKIQYKRDFHVTERSSNSTLLANNHANNLPQPNQNMDHFIDKIYGLPCNRNIQHSSPMFEIRFINHKFNNKSSFWYEAWWLMNPSKLANLFELFATTWMASKERDGDRFLCVHNNWYKQSLNFNWI